MKFEKKKLPKYLLLLFVISGVIVFIVKAFKKNSDHLVRKDPGSLAELNSLPIVVPPVLVPIGVLGQILENHPILPTWTPSDLIVPVPLPKVKEYYTPDVLPIKDYNVPADIPIDVDPYQYIKVYTDGSVPGDLITVRNKSLQ